MARIAICLMGLFAIMATLSPSTALAQGAGIKRGPSGLPLPRFVSLKSGKVNLRVGPGRSYRVDWLYKKSGLPVEIIQEYDNWRLIRDSEGTQGWVYQSLLSGRRTAVAAPWRERNGKLIDLKSRPNNTANIKARLQPGVITRIESCDGKWCAVKVKDMAGWVNQEEIWGAYPGESFDN